MHSTDSRLKMLLAIFVTLCTALCVAKAEGQDSNGPFECYSCLGRDYDNCMFGKTSCAGACWKLVDQEHEIIAKGCTSQDRSDGSQEADVDMKVNLPWSQGERDTLHGTTYYCKSDLCNGGGQFSPASVGALCLFALIGTVVGRNLIV